MGFVQVAFHNPRSHQAPLDVLHPPGHTYRRGEPPDMLQPMRASAGNSRAIHWAIQVN